MPEMPEVEAFKKYVELHSLHKKIVEVTVSVEKVIQGISPTVFKKRLANASFSKVERKGKYLIITLSPSPEKLVFHFGLTGFLMYEKSPKIDVHFSRTSFIFSDQSILHWCSIRLFGKIWLVKNLATIKEIANLGPNALTLSEKKFLNLMTKSKRKNIKSFLMDQETIAGIGNEYSDEILFQAGVAPYHPIKELSQKRRIRIYEEMDKVLRYAIKLRTTEITNMPSAGFFTAGESAKFPSTYLQAHRHTDQRCPKNRTHQLKKAKIAGRTAYYCPKDQT
ncbi:MAG: Fpg/Nei family DNA glycosylase [Candidatus Babeliaceae bacterium]|nr:Fpg/Nei family DNA glycosylase [Candidatus Babeliaceae bacterium]